MKYGVLSVIDLTVDVMFGTGHAATHEDIRHPGVLFVAYCCCYEVR